MAPSRTTVFLRARTVLAMAVVACLAAAPSAAVAQSAGAKPQAEARMITDLRSATGLAYDLRTTTGSELDALNLINGPRPGTYVGVYHSPEADGYFRVSVATSTNLVSWTSVALLSRSASMPTIAADGEGGYLVAFEAAEPAGRSEIEVEHFSNYRLLLAGRQDRRMLLPRRLSATNEGTPSFMSVRLRGGLGDSDIVVGFHYNAGAGVDRNGIGVLSDFRRWSERTNGPLNHALEAAGVQGSIGGRTQVTIGSDTIELVGAQATPGTWDSWQIYAYDPRTGRGESLRMTLPSGAPLSVELPELSIVTNASGVEELVATAFVHRQGSARVAHGEMLWWRPLDG